jgi:hypothetical protein
MRRTLALLLGLALPALSQANPLVDAPLLPPLAAAMAQGGSFTANASGFEGLFYNPAGLVSPKGSFTAYSLTTWMYADPVGAVQALLGPDSVSGFVDGQIEGGGFGFGINEGIAYVGRGVALGVVINLEAFLRGTPAAAAVGDLYYTVACYSGFAFPVRIGPVTLNLGLLARPMFRLRAPLPAGVGYTIMQDFVDGLFLGGDPMANLNTTNALFGIGLGVDVGAIAELGNLRVGLAVTDLLGTRFHYTEDTVGNVLTSLRDTGGFPTGGPAVDGHYVPADLSVGVSYQLNIKAIRNLFDATFHASLSDIADGVREGRSALLLLHAGTELRLFKYLSLRGGCNQGYLTFGLGARLSVLDLNLAYFSRETGSEPWESPGRGLSIEAALRR